MEFVVTSEEMKQYDSYTIHQIGIPAEVLMERAALFSFAKLKSFCLNRQILIQESKILVVAGVGNNGGDGLALARLLADYGLNVTIFIVGDKAKMSAQCKLQFQIIEKYNLNISDIYPDDEYDIIVDAIFGIGLSREISGIFAEVIEKINASKALVVSLDIPSGIETDTGKLLGVAVKADATFTFAYHKRGLLFYPGAEYAGKVYIGEIGINDRSFSGNPPEMFTFQHSEWKLLVQKRKESGNKGTFGKVLMLCGSKDMAGAAIFSSKACYRSGAGMVKVITPEENRVVLQESVPEAMLLTYSETSITATEWRNKLNESIAWADVLLAGPGLGRSDVCKELLSVMINASDKTLVLDADALNLLSEDMVLQNDLVKSIDSCNRKVILTPHVGELSRLIKWSISEIKGNPVAAAREAVSKYKCIVVCKDARTIVCQPKRPIYLNSVGNSGLATAGTGDVLAGMISALSCKKDGDGFIQAISGVYLHAIAGEVVSFAKSKESMMASDLIDALTYFQKVLTGEVDE